MGAGGLGAGERRKQRTSCERLATCCLKLGWSRGLQCSRAQQPTATSAADRTLQNPAHPSLIIQQLRVEEEGGEEGQDRGNRVGGAPLVKGGVAVPKGHAVRCTVPRPAAGLHGAADRHGAGVAARPIADGGLLDAWLGSAWAPRGPGPLTQGPRGERRRWGGAGRGRRGSEGPQRGTSL